MACAKPAACEWPHSQGGEKGISLELSSERGRNSGDAVGGPAFSMLAQRTSVSELNSCPLMKAMSPMAQLKKMLEGDFRGPHVVQNNVGHTLHVVVTGHRDHGNRERKVQECRPRSGRRRSAPGKSRGYSSIRSARWGGLRQNKSNPLAGDDLPRRSSPKPSSHR